MERSASGLLGSACVPRAGFGVTPKQAFVVGCCTMRLLPREKSAIARRNRQHAGRVRHPEMRATSPWLADVAISLP